MHTGKDRAYPMVRTEVFTSVAAACHFPRSWLSAKLLLQSLRDVWHEPECWTRADVVME